MPQRPFGASRVLAVSPMCPLLARLGGANEPSRSARDLWDRPVPVPTTFAVLARCPGRASCSGHRPSKLRFLCPSLSCDTLVTVIGHMLVERTSC